MADSYWTSKDGVRINISHLGPDQVKRVKAMDTGAKAQALAQTLTRSNANNGKGADEAKPNYSAMTLPQLQAALKNEKYPSRAQAIREQIAERTTGQASAPTAPVASAPSAQAPTPSTAPAASTSPTEQPRVLSPVNTPVEVEPAINKKTGATNVVTATNNAQALTEDAATTNFNLNNPGTETDASGNTIVTQLNPDGTVSRRVTAGAGLVKSQNAFTGALDTVMKNGALDLSGAPLIDASGAGRDKAQDAVYNYITKTYERDKGREIEAAKQELAQRGIPIDNSPNSLWGKTVGAIDEKYRALDDQAKNQAVTQGNQYFATNVGAQAAAGDQFTRDRSTQFQGNLGAVGTLGNTVAQQQPNSFAAFAGGNYDNVAPLYAGFTQMEVDRIMKERGLNMSQAIAELNARRSGGSGGSSGATSSFGGDLI